MIWDGILSHIFEGIYDKFSNPWLTVFVQGIAKYDYSSYCIEFFVLQEKPLQK